MQPPDTRSHLRGSDAETVAAEKLTAMCGPYISYGTFENSMYLCLMTINLKVSYYN